MSTSTPLSFSMCQRLTNKSLGHVIDFAQTVENLYPGSGFLQPILKLDELKTRVNTATNEFLTGTEIDDYIKPMVMQIVSWNKKISDQLLDFWKAQIDIGNTAVSVNSRYDPLEIANQGIKKINYANKVFVSTVEALHLDPQNKNYLYALFYAQILATETAEFSFRKQLETLLKKYDLDKKYDATEIFSIDEKIPKGATFRTDSRAIRDSLAHYQYQIETVGGTWEIKFSNVDDGYNFTPIYTREEFLNHMKNADVLYKSQAYLIWLYIGSATVNHAFQIP